MKLLLEKNNSADSKSVVLDDMILTTDMPSTAGSKMLEGYKSLFEAEVVTKLKDKGYQILGKSNVGEFGFDLLGESSYYGRIEDDGKIKNATAQIVKSKEAEAAVVLEVNGAYSRAAGQEKLCFLKPTYSLVSRFGTIPVVCSAETVGVLASNASKCEEILDVIAGYDCKDGTSAPIEFVENKRKAISNKKKVAVLKSMLEGVDEDIMKNITEVCETLKANNIAVCEIDDVIIKNSRATWNILMSAELCNNVSKYDGVKYGYRSNEYSNIDELYTNSRSEAFGDLLKYTILYGSETLSTENYKKVYDKAQRVRRVISEEFSKIFEEFDAVIMPTCSKSAYLLKDVDEDKALAFKENFYTAPALLCGLPAITVSGVQFVSEAFAENKLFELAKLCEKEGK